MSRQFDDDKLNRDTGSDSTTPEIGSDKPEPPVRYGQPDSSRIIPQEYMNADGGKDTDPPPRHAGASDMQNSRQETSVIPTYLKLTRDEGLLFESARRLVNISQICAIVSLFFGGVILALVALIMAIAGYRKLLIIVDAHDCDRITRRLFLRSAQMAALMCALALVINAVSLIMVYPFVAEMIRTGSYESLLGPFQPQTNSSSIWG